MVATNKKTKKKVEQVECIDIGTPEGLNTIQELCDGGCNDNFHNYMEKCSLENYLTLAKSPLTCNGLSVFQTTSGFVVVQNGVCYGTNYIPYDEDAVEEYETVVANEDAIAVFAKTKGNKLCLLLNGDMEDEWNRDVSHSVNLVDDLKSFQLPIASFRCLNRFYDTEGAVYRLATGKITIVDFTSDETIKFNSQEAKKFNAGKSKELVPPKPGFVAFNGYWHRTGTTLLYDAEKELCILMGRDEGSYFGCELPKYCRNIKEALSVLIPPEVKKSKKPYVRQGEWFVVQVSEKSVPPKNECVILLEGNDTILPVETDDSNEHRLSTDDGRVSKDGKLYAHNPSLEHEEHDSVDMEGWCTFYKNTALRSFSQEGVD